MTNLHDTLHDLSKQLNNLESVITASDILVTDLFKKHIKLNMDARERQKLIQEQIDNLIINGTRNIHEMNGGEWS